MRIITMYEAEDGEAFYSEKQCLTHEKALADVRLANQMLKDGCNLFDVLTVAGGDFPSTKCLSEEDKAILRSMTKDTGVTIEHWQCSDKPAYKAILIPYPKRGCAGDSVQMHGDVGRWSGPYGSKVTVKDLIRYARATFEKANKPATSFAQEE